MLTPSAGRTSNWSSGFSPDTPLVLWRWSKECEIMKKVNKVMFAYVSDGSVNIVPRYFHRNGVATTHSWPTCTHQKNNPASSLALYSTSYKYRPIHVFPTAHRKQRGCGKICKTLLPEKSHMHILLSRHKTFSPLTRRWPPRQIWISHFGGCQSHHPGDVPH